MKRKELDELEGRQLEKSWKIPGSVGQQTDEDEYPAIMDANMLAAVEKLPPELQDRAWTLWDALTELNVKKGIKNRLMGMGHMGVIGDPIWKYIYKLRTGSKAVRDKGGWLVKCLLNHRLNSKR